MYPLIRRKRLIRPVIDVIGCSLKIWSTVYLYSCSSACDGMDYCNIRRLLYSERTYSLIHTIML